MKIVLCVTLLLVGCGNNLTVHDRLTICKTICGDRPMDDFSVSGYSDDGFTCRCGKKEPPPPSPCDAGNAEK